MNDPSPFPTADADPTAAERQHRLAADALEAGSILLLSPHLDDAILSAGGLLAQRHQQRRDSTVLTVFAGVASPPFSDFATAFHSRCGLGDDATVRRRSEDAAALATVGARCLHGDPLDAIYRRAADGTWLYRRSAQLFAPSDPRDAVAAAVDELIAATIARVVPDLVLAPLGLGDHVDHLAVQSSARLIGRERGIPVLLWEDQPYALRRHPWASPPAGATTALQVPLPPAAWSRKIEAIRCYTSQLRMLFDPDEDWAALFTGYATAVSGTGGEPAERFWV